MRRVLAVVDDFLPEPDDVRNRALGLAFKRPAGVNYPGLTAPAPEDLTAILERFSRLLGGFRLKSAPNDGAYRVTTASDMGRRTSLVHADAPQFSAILHLSARSMQGAMEGTFFYRHKALDIERVVPGSPWLSQVRAAVQRDTLDLAAWETTQIVPMRYNRLVIFDGKFFHSGPRVLTGDDLASGRLTRNFFFWRDDEVEQGFGMPPERN